MSFNPFSQVNNSNTIYSVKAPNGISKLVLIPLVRSIIQICLDRRHNVYELLGVF